MNIYGSNNLSYKSHKVKQSNKKETQSLVKYFKKFLLVLNFGVLFILIINLGCYREPSKGAGHLGKAKGGVWATSPRLSQPRRGWPAAPPLPSSFSPTWGS